MVAILEWLVASWLAYVKGAHAHLHTHAQTFVCTFNVVLHI